MSTILDALRKVEQDHRAQSTDVRVRLLTLPPRPHSRAPQKKLPPWLMSLGLAVIGFLIGAGIIVYRPSPIITLMTAESAGSAGADSSSPSARTGKVVAESAPDRLAAAPVVEDTPPVEPSQPFVPIPTSQEQSATALVSGQRSPFISRLSPESSKSAYAARPVTPAALPAASQDEYIIEPLPQDLWDNENETLPPEDEAHFISPSPESLPAPVISSAPSTPPVHLDASLSLVQWSPKATERFVSIKVADGPLTMVYEGDSVGGFTILKIHKSKVDLRSNDADGADLTLHLR